MTGIAYLRIELNQLMHIGCVLRSIKVYLVKYKFCRDTIGLGSSKEAVNKRRAGLGSDYCTDEEGGI